MNRLYVIESTPTITGAMADHRLPLRPSQIEAVARAVLQRAKSASSAAPEQQPIAGIPEKWLATLLKDLAEHRGKSLVIAGPGQAPAPAPLSVSIPAIDVESTLVKLGLRPNRSLEVPADGPGAPERSGVGEQLAGRHAWRRAAERD